MGILKNMNDKFINAVTCGDSLDLVNELDDNLANKLMQQRQ